jgi:hypothetical protein
MEIGVSEIGPSEIGLGSLVVDAAAGSGMAMVIAALDGDHAYCVATDARKSVRQWRHCSSLRRAGRDVSQRASGQSGRG